MLQLEAISNPEILQQELENIKVLQEEISEHEDAVEKLHEAAKCLLSLSNDVVPNVLQLRKTTGSSSAEGRTTTCAGSRDGSRTNSQ
ncbi:microtubule-actin cross-linking factor 1-like isoform X2 [Narcine bancroftii]|uniref:microtubule-actin cross-linking factor 1-like isoform X2 n=1 Tax=Narcine bancroftii TaxID=1343680 RepID=UPI003831CBB7